MLEIDKVTESALIASGVTSMTVSHTPVGTPRAVVVLGAFRGASSTGLSASPTYGGEAMTAVEDNTRGTTPFPATRIWLKDNCKSGTQDFVCAKNTALTGRVVIITLLADGAVTVGISAGGNSATQNPAVPAMTVVGGGVGLAFAILSAAQDALPNTRSWTLLEQEDDGDEVYDSQYVAYDSTLADGIIASWAMATSDQTARTGAIFLDPNPAAPESEGFPFTGNWETGDDTQFSHTQAIEGRLTVQTDVVAEGTYAGRFEVQDGDVEPETKDERCEVTGPLTIIDDDTELYFRMLVRIESWDWDAWGMIWQFHDAAGGSPPLALMLTDNEGPKQIVLANGSGTPAYWVADFPGLDEWFEVVIRAVFSETIGEVQVWLNGELQVLTNETTEITGANTLGTAPGYDKLGIYRSGDATATTAIYHDDYRITTEFFSDPPEPPPGKAGKRMLRMNG